MADIVFVSFYDDNDDENAWFVLVGTVSVGDIGLELIKYPK